jgi:hypothetical protein
VAEHEEDGMSVDVMAAMDETLGHLTTRRLPKKGNLSEEHLLAMRAEVATWDLADRSRLEKANRYLGWMQGVAEAKGVSNDVLRAINLEHATEPTPFDVLEIRQEIQIQIEIQPAGWELLARRLLEEKEAGMMHGVSELREAPEMCWHTQDPQVPDGEWYRAAMSFARELIQERKKQPQEARQWTVVLATTIVVLTLVPVLPALVQILLSLVGLR